MNGLHLEWLHPYHLLNFWYLRIGYVKVQHKYPASQENFELSNKRFIFINERYVSSNERYFTYRDFS